MCVSGTGARWQRTRKVWYDSVKGGKVTVGEWKGVEVKCHTESTIEWGE